MEDGVKGSSVSPSVPKVIHKAGWLKKSSGLLGLWKDRYIQILQTQLLVCDNEDEQRGAETLELSNYERCQDQKAFLKRKRHFNLIPSPGTKVQDVKLQAKNIEERDAWIQALNDGINRGKNKIFDEVKVDTSCSLEHVTRERVKVAATKRRPPTRIHLKEVAEAADDDSLRLGLEALDTGILTVVTPTPRAKDVEPQPQKEPVKIPMPPTKPNNPQPVESSVPDTTDREIQAPSAPTPPPKILKQSVYAHERLLSENEEKRLEEKSGLKTPNSLSREDLTDVVSSPPKPPPKILSDKMKIKWVGSSSDVLEKESIASDERGSKENLVDFESDELEKTLSTFQGVLSEDMERKEENGSISSLQEESQWVADLSNDKVTDKEDIQNEMSSERTSNCIEIQEKDMFEENEMLTEEIQEMPRGQPITLLSEKKKTPELQHNKKAVLAPIQLSGLERRIKALSMGDLLSEDTKDYENEREHDNSIIQLTKDHFYKMEMKLACGRERTESLLNQVLKEQLRQTPEGNTLDVNQVTLLNEVMKDLQEASEVLKEIKGPKNISNIPEVVTEKQKEKQKELLALQRRSVPF
ncbi:pleckstrin homology domain-containing family O member 2 [Mixophyes fleayi]|uniref:pleckstrin homology domain-containing family O member 2 n=1 Tax=Mixophyes fleayi TaxID=3061075 RepID=UPI003F4D9354